MNKSREPKGENGSKQAGTRLSRVALVASAVMLVLAALSASSPTPTAAQTKAVHYLVASKLIAAKRDGRAQALDVYAYVTNEFGKPVTDAKVVARATDYHNYVEQALVSLGDGHYWACAMGSFSGYGAGAVAVHVRAERPGYRGGENDVQSVVGRLCTK